MTEETPMLVDDVRARVADFRRRYWITLTRGQVEALLTAGLDALTKAEADRDAYAAVLRPLMRRAENGRTWARCWDCGSLNRLDNHDADCIAPALDALTPEQKERIT